MGMEEILSNERSPVIQSLVQCQVRWHFLLSLGMRFSCLTVSGSCLFTCSEVPAKPQATVVLYRSASPIQVISEKQEYTQLHIYLCLGLWIAHVYILKLYLEFCLRERQGFFHVTLIISEGNRKSSLNQHLCLTISIIRLIIFWRHPRNPIMHVCICVCWSWHYPCPHILKQAYLLGCLLCFHFFSPFHRWYTDWWSPKAYATNYTPSTESTCVLSCSNTMLVTLRQGTRAPQKWWTV